MSSYVLLEGHQKILTRLRRWITRAPALTAEAMVEAVQADIVQQIRAKLEENDSVYTGELLRSIDAFVVSAGAKPQIAVGAFAPHASIVESGSDPHPVDIDKIADWLVVKNGLDPQEAMSAAYSVAASIEERGTIAHPFIRPVIEANAEVIVQGTAVRLKQKLQSTL